MSSEPTVSKHGYFRPTDQRLDGLKFGNWGSRPYEYMWAATVEDNLEGKTVLDLGTGLPSEHNWHAFVRQYLKPKSYVGIDFDDRMHGERIDEDTHKMVWMDMTNLQFPDESFDFCYSLSTYEHIPTAETFFKAMEETHRVLKPGAPLVVTLDEIWHTGLLAEPTSPELNPLKSKVVCQTWNDLERDLKKHNYFSGSFGLRHFGALVSKWFKPLGLESWSDIPEKRNADTGLLHSVEYNSVVSYGVFVKV